MVKINFNYDIDKDSWSWVSIAKDKNLWGLDWRSEVAHIPDDLLNKILKLNFKTAEVAAKQYIEKNPKAIIKHEIVKIQILALQKAWRFVEKKYFEILESVIQKPIFIDSFGCYFTTGLMCPYNEKENWFMVSMWHSIPFSITTICHEIMHLQFLHYFKAYLKKKGLKNNQIEDLKESLTFLLNEPEFNKIIMCKDVGYPEHIKLRKKLQNIWLKNKNFQNLIDEAIMIVLKK
ncbi:MAG: hypothetical protein WC415_03815 [Patescibacteria group bacterium]|jgi:hypothetical protein